ncbi:MAG: hypothetical protein M4579_003665 [Chaenotheca gracillima]|nr:MAG: hypothetical protein M4579_003665 [Chaenotheca gracillima]
MSSMQGDYEDLQRKNHDLTEAYREKDRKHSQVQQLYDKLKKRSLFTQAQQAASESVEDALQNVAGAGRRVPGSVGTLMNSPRYTASAGNAGQHQRHSAELNIPGLQRSLGGNISQMPPPMHRAGPGFTKPANTLGTPIQHRQQLSMASPRGNLHAPFYQNNRQDNNVGPNHSHMQSPSPKRALHKLNANHGSPRFATYGVSAGMKMSR